MTLIEQFDAAAEAYARGGAAVLRGALIMNILETLLSNADVAPKIPTGLHAPQQARRLN